MTAQPIDDADERAAIEGESDPRRKCTDTGNAERLIALYGNALRYCAPWKAWLVWDGKRWERDVRGRVHHYAKLTARSIYSEAARIEDADVRKAVAEWAKKSESRDKRAAMVVCAQSEPSIAVHFADLDRDPMLLNVTNGTIDLKTGVRRAHERNDLITKLAPVEHVENASAPLFDAFLAQVLPDSDVRTFLQRFAGCCLSGDVSHRVFVFLAGTGRNGKSVLLRVLRTLLGDYAIVAAPDLLMAKKEAAHPTELADLFGARLVVCQEVSKGRTFNEQRVKELTGNEGALRVRRMNEDFWEFAPTFKIAIAGNHQPRVVDDTDSIWDRMRKVPFRVRIANEQIDPHLFDKLRAEFPGILRWALAGCLDWQTNGLPAPKAVAVATESYRTDEDTLGRFFADCCVLEAEARITTKSIASAVAEWCVVNGEREISRKAITDRLKSTPGCAEKRTNRARGWTGIRLLNADEIAARDAEDRGPGDAVTESDAPSGVSSRETSEGPGVAPSTSRNVTPSLPGVQ